MNYLVMEGMENPEKDEYVTIKKSELSSLREEASLWRSCYADRCNNKYVEVTIVEELERIISKLS